jgi:hypothetical protein
MYDPTLKRTDYVHRIVWRRVYGRIPRGLDVDHKCYVTLCQRPTRRRGPTRCPNRR